MYPEETKTRKSLSDAIKKSGFLLENKCASVFISKKFTVLQNYLLPAANALSESGHRLVELDIFAFRKIDEAHDESFIVECKGSDSKDMLILNRFKSEELFQAPRIFYGPEQVNVDNTKGYFFRFEKEKCNDPYICHTGDFLAFNKPSHTYSRSDAQEEKTKLFKGINQLFEALECQFEDQRAVWTEITPILVTNAQVAVVDHDITGDEEEVSPQQVPWAAYRNLFSYASRNTKLGKTVWTLGNNTSVEKLFAERKQFPVIWIVNINHLEEFLASTNKEYLGFK